MKRTTIHAIIVCGLLAAGTTFQGCQKVKADVPRQTADSAAVKVAVSEVKETPFEDWGSYSADLRGVEDANLTAPYQGGRVTMLKPIGAHVSAGEPLCSIDGDKYEAALQAANAQVEVAKGELERAKANVEKGSLGRSVLDAANLAFQNARMLQATAQRAFEDCRCQAPFDGVLVSRYIDKFQTVQPGIPTVRVSRVDRLEAVIAIPETEAFSYVDGMKAEFRLLQSPDRAYQGKISSVDRAVDSRSRTVSARIVIENGDGSLKPGMIGRARILRKTYAKAVVVPAASLLHLQNGIYAMVAENGVARQRPVKLGAGTDANAMILDGLHAGDQLIVSGAFQVTDGTRVQY
jgi:membrane fusion protein (multidrug efflux system)